MSAPEPLLELLLELLELELLLELLELELLLELPLHPLLELLLELLELLLDPPSQPRSIKKAANKATAGNKKPFFFMVPPSLGNRLIRRVRELMVTEYHPARAASYGQTPKCVP
jgi:hypothetical protein